MDWVGWLGSVEDPVLESSADFVRLEAEPDWDEDSPGILAVEAAEVTGGAKKDGEELVAPLGPGVWATQYSLGLVVYVLLGDVFRQLRILASSRRR